MDNNFDNRDFDMFEGVSAENLRNIEYAKTLYQSEDDEVKKHEALRDLTLRNIITSIKSSVKFWWFDFSIEDAIKWLEISKTKYDQRKKYNEKELRDILDKFTEFDYKSKRGEIDLRTGIETVICCLQILV